MDKTSASVVTRTVTYYPAGGAMRINIVGGNNTVYYLLKDQLGSASVVTNSSGVTLGEQRYYPYGETRVSTGTIYTDKLFTGQRDTGLGIYDFHARFYSQKLGRFLSPDSIVPGAGNPQAYNRYSYTLGNPLRYIDPTGHSSCVGGHYDDGPECAKKEGSQLNIEIKINQYQNKVKKDTENKIKNIIDDIDDTVENLKETAQYTTTTIGQGFRTCTEKSYGCGPKMMQAIDQQFVKPFIDSALQTADEAITAYGRGFQQDAWAIPMGPRFNPINNVMPSMDTGGTVKLH